MEVRKKRRKKINKSVKPGTKSRLAVAPLQTLKPTWQITRGIYLYDKWNKVRLRHRNIVKKSKALSRTRVYKILESMTRRRAGEWWVFLNIKPIEFP